MRFFFGFTLRPTEWLKVDGINSNLEGDEKMHVVCRLKQIKGRDKLVDQGEVRQYNIKIFIEKRCVNSWTTIKRFRMEPD